MNSLCHSGEFSRFTLPEGHWQCRVVLFGSTQYDRSIAHTLAPKLAELTDEVLFGDV